MGKRADRLPLPFPVLDGGFAERAPIFGVVAALRAARRDICVVLPVDCPLVTEEALRALAVAGAVPQTEPLPGAYAKAMLPELEERIGGGELALRGVNPRVLELDPGLLVNVNTQHDLTRLAGRLRDLARPASAMARALLPGSGRPRPSSRRCR